MFESFKRSFPVLYFYYLKFIKVKKTGHITSLIYKIEDLSETYYQKIKQCKLDELEHQIGRLRNFKNIIQSLALDAIEGDVIEFGTWQGFSLLWIAYFIERNALMDKKIVGLDSFDGLPYDDGVFTKFDFSDTSLSLCKRNLYDNIILYPQTKKNVHIEKCLFREKDLISKYLSQIGSKKFCFIHIDCDVSQSVVEIFDLLIEADLIADKAYILFDDYYCKSNLQETVMGIFDKGMPQWNITPHSRTNLTRNYFFERKGN